MSWGWAELGNRPLVLASISRLIALPLLSSLSLVCVFSQGLKCSTCPGFGCQYPHPSKTIAQHKRDVCLNLISSVEPPQASFITPKVSPSLFHAYWEAQHSVCGRLPRNADHVNFKDKFQRATSTFVAIVKVKQLLSSLLFFYSGPIQGRCSVWFPWVCVSAHVCGNPSLGGFIEMNGTGRQKTVRSSRSTVGLKHSPSITQIHLRASEAHPVSDGGGKTVSPQGKDLQTSAHSRNRPHKQDACVYGEPEPFHRYLQ